MHIASVTEADHADFLALVNAEIRPDRAKTNAVDDFPIILGPQNHPWQLIFRTEDGTIAGCIACLIRSLETSCGPIPVAGIGSVVTRPEMRGKGLSRALQSAMLEKLKGKNIPLGVLWTDQPEIYSGRGFSPAGWEIHVSLANWSISGLQDNTIRVENFTLEDLAAVESLYNRHPLRTLRSPGDSRAYYGMLGTRGLVGRDPSGRVLAYAFCGKGGDFPGYVCEWGGEIQALLPVLAQAREKDLADHVLIPPGREDLVNTLVDGGASWGAISSGQWVVLDPVSLAANLPVGEEAGGDPWDPRSWLGDVGSDGQPLVGPLTAAVWGFDSV